MSNKEKTGQELPPGVPRANDGTKDAIAISRANGAAGQATEPAPASPVRTPLNPAQQAFLTHCQAILETVAWGTITKFQGFTANIVMIAMCRALGMIVGTMFHGSLADILLIRRQCREAFLQGLMESPPPHHYGQPPAGAGDVPFSQPYGRQKVNGQ